MTQKTASPATDEEIAEIKRRGLGLSIEDEERVFARIEEQKGQIADLGAQLAAAKARERELREALRNACGWHDLLSPNPCPSGCRWTDEDPSRYVHVAACSAQSTGEAATSPRGRGDGRGAMNCPKAPHHENSGYLHDPDDDRPYYVDGLWYCGRCHYFLESNMTCARSSSLPAEHEGRAE